MEELNKLARELYGEFGFFTCTEDEQVRLIEIWAAKEQINGGELS